uniref:CNNM transmembrane domain-containing protein n=1 Tax=Panagrellus redivivus TaxID=6233 RepID=A0A7E4UQ89_PANRE
MSAIRRFESRERHMTVRPGCVSPVLEGAPGATCIDFCMFGNISGNSHLHELLSSQEESGFCMLVNKQKGTRFHVTEIICFCMVFPTLRRFKLSDAFNIHALRLMLEDILQTLNFPCPKVGARGEL